MRNKWIPALNSRYKNIDTYSWFNMKITENSKVDVEDTNFTRNYAIIRSKKIRLYPDNNQIIILQKWFELFRKMYNKTAKFLNKKLLTKDNKLKKHNILLYLNFRKLRSDYLKDVRDDLVRDNINVHLLDQSISRCVAMFKSAILNLKAGYIKEFRIRKLKQNKRFKNLIIEGGLFSKVKNGFCISVLKEIPSEEELIGINKTCVLTYDKNKSSYILSVPVETNNQDCLSRNLTCGIDPGCRTFLTLYSRKDVVEICSNKNILKESFKKIDKINSFFDAEESKQTRKYSRAISKVYDKMNNRVRDMHFKISKYLCEHYNIIKLGNFSTKKVALNESSKLHKSTKRMLYALSHYKFREILRNQAEKYGVIVNLVSEYMTTKTCSKCKNRKEIGRDEIYSCEKCGLIAGRDINAAKNIRYI